MKRYVIALSSFLFFSSSIYANGIGEIGTNLGNNYQLKREKQNIVKRNGLQIFKIFNGRYGVSTDGWGGKTHEIGKILAYIPQKATVEAAYLYAAGVGTDDDVYDVNFSGNLIHFNDNDIWDGEGYLTARKDVTNIVKKAIQEGSCNKEGNCSFPISELGYNDGESLVVIYKDYSVPKSTIAILDGHAKMRGDESVLNLENPINKDGNFYAHMYLGISYSYDVNTSHDQFSKVTVNDKNLTNYAGSQDDGYPDNGGLITVGSFYDSFTPINTQNWKLDHEKYDITPLLRNGDKQIKITTYNSSLDDNVFLVVYHISKPLSNIYIKGGPIVKGPKYVVANKNDLLELDYNISNSASVPIDINISIKGDLNELNSEVLNPEILNSKFDINETKILRLKVDESKLLKTDNKIIIVARDNNISAQENTIIHIKNNDLFSNLNLVKGWNLVGAKDNIRVNDIVSSLESKGWKVKLIYKYENNQWLLNIVDKNKFSNTIGLPDFDKVSKEEGMWIYIVPK